MTYKPAHPAKLCLFYMPNAQLQRETQAHQARQASCHQQAKQGHETPHANEALQAQRATRSPQALQTLQAHETPQARSGWYVVQVITGAEERMCDAIRRACDEHDGAARADGDRVALKECFSPRFASRRKRMGEWRGVERALLPGYVIADVRNPAMLAQSLRNVQDFARVLASDETYSPLNDAERTWLEAQSSETDRTIPLSFGHREGEKLVVTSGPLKGNEAMITKVDRKNCMAHVEFHAGPITIKTTVGLVVEPNGKIAQE